ncbi:uncharacterized protein LOC143878123 [Tasmannia lanceolata]|uniref:uncharacterized protein LOC143878123 n=1 Tax=Tasmannia lanceolata TaxID=3420 RepID=UPI00406449EE
MLSSSCSNDVVRAWKIMEIAKSIQSGHDGPAFGHHDPNCPSIKRNVPKDVSNMNSSSCVLKSEPFPHTALGNPLSEDTKRYHSLELAPKEWKYQLCQKQKQGIATTKANPTIARGPIGSTLSASCELPSTKQELKSFQVVHRASDLVDGSDVPPCSTSDTYSLSGASDLPFSRTKPVASSCCKIEPKRKGGFDKSFERSVRNDDGAKSEIQSLVKLNLKLLSRDRLLGVDRFKEIARLATHTILAACGLEHSKSSVRSYPRSICCHTDKLPHLRPSKLMPSSCRECFYVFVKDVVNSVMEEKTGLPESS